MRVVSHEKSIKLTLIISELKVLYLWLLQKHKKARPCILEILMNLVFIYFCFVESLSSLWPPSLDLLLLTSKIESVLSKIKKKLKLLIKKFYFYYYYNCERLYFHSFRPLIRQTKYIYIVLVV